MQKFLLILILTMSLGIVLTANAAQCEDSFDSTQIARTINEITEVKDSPDPSAENLNIIEQLRSLVVLLDEAIGDDGKRWYRVYNPDEYTNPYGYVPAEALQIITHDVMTDWEISYLYDIEPCLAITRRNHTAGYERPEGASQIKRIIPLQGTLVYVYSVYPGYSDVGYALYDENWYYVMLPDHETYLYVRGSDLWTLDRIRIHEESDFFAYLEPQEPVKGRTWQTAYLSILKKYQSRLNNMEKSKIYKNAKPVTLWDINGDGIKELLFVIHDKVGLDLYNNNNELLNDLSYSELLIFSYIDNEAVNLLHLTAPSDPRHFHEDTRDEFFIYQSENGIIISFVSYACANKTLTIEYGFDGTSFQELGKYHDLYSPYHGGGVIYGTFPVTFLYERGNIGDEILCSLMDNAYDGYPGLSFKEAQTELKR